MEINHIIHIGNHNENVIISMLNKNEKSLRFEMRGLYMKSLFEC